MHLKTKYKLSLLIIFFLILVIIFIVMYFVPRNYNITYLVNNNNITESYEKTDNIYKLSINGIEYYINDTYSSKRRFVTNVNIKNNCVSFTFKSNSYNVCYQNGEYYSKYIDENLDKNKISTYKNVNIYDFNKSKYYIWNYNYFIILDENSNNTLKLFDNDIYELKYISIINDDLIVADYNNEYTFNTFYLIDTTEDSYKKIKLLQDLSFEGYILGTYKNNIYLYDSKMNKEYKFNPYKEEITKISYRILINNKFESISSNKLSKMKYYFTNDSNFYYYIENNILYYHNYDQNIKITNLSIDKIIKSNNKECYFISNGYLYYNNFENGTKLIMDYSEWKFNYNNIYIFDN